MKIIWLMASIGVSVFFFGNDLVFAADSKKLPRNIGPNIALGMTVADFETNTGIVPGSCATCEPGELLAEFEGKTAEKLREDLRKIGLTQMNHDFTVNCFFIDGRLYNIYIGKFNSRGMKKKLKKLWGSYKIVQKNTDLTSVEWVDRRTRIRFTEFDEEGDLIIIGKNIRRNIKRPN